MDTLLSLAAVAGFFLVLALAVGFVLFVVNRFTDAGKAREGAVRVQVHVEPRLPRSERDNEQDDTAPGTSAWPELRYRHRIKVAQRVVSSHRHSAPVPVSPDDNGDKGRN